MAKVSSLICVVMYIVCAFGMMVVGMESDSDPNVILKSASEVVDYVDNLSDCKQLLENCLVKWARSSIDMSNIGSPKDVKNLFTGLKKFINANQFYKVSNIRLPSVALNAENAHVAGDGCPICFPAHGCKGSFPNIIFVRDENSDFFLNLFNKYFGRYYISVVDKEPWCPRAFCVELEKKESSSDKKFFYGYYNDYKNQPHGTTWSGLTTTANLLLTGLWVWFCAKGPALIRSVLPQTNSGYTRVFSYVPFLLPAVHVTYLTYKKSNWDRHVPRAGFHNPLFQVVEVTADLKQI